VGQPPPAVMGLSSQSMAAVSQVIPGRQSNFTAQDRQSKMGTGSVAAINFGPQTSVSGDGACPLFRRTLTPVDGRCQPQAVLGPCFQHGSAAPTVPPILLPKKLSRPFYGRPALRSRCKLRVITRHRALVESFSARCLHNRSTYVGACQVQHARGCHCWLVQQCPSRATITDIKRIPAHQK
jgi:hypothetical protein